MAPTKTIHTTSLSSKLDHKQLGQFKILERIGTHAYHLELPSSMKVHLLFHMSQLEPVSTNPLPTHLQPPAPPIIVEGDTQVQDDKVFDSRLRGVDLQYYVQWTGYDAPTWLRRLRPRRKPRAPLAVPYRLCRPTFRQPAQEKDSPLPPLESTCQ